MSIRKTDKEDSLKLAKFLKNHDEDELPILTPNDEEWERRKLLSKYRSLRCMRTKEINKLHEIFEHNGYTQFVRKDKSSETRCIGKGKSIVTSARKLGELLYLILKTD